MADKKLTELVKRFYYNTLNGKVLWERTSEDGVFTTSFRNYSVQISVETSLFSTEGGQDDVVIRIHDLTGALVEEIRDTDFSPDDIKDSYKFMFNIYVVARRQAMGVEEAINSLLSELPDDEIPF